MPTGAYSDPRRPASVDHLPRTAPGRTARPVELTRSVFGPARLRGVFPWPPRQRSQDIRQRPRSRQRSWGLAGRSSGVVTACISRGAWRHRSDVRPLTRSLCDYPSSISSGTRRERKSYPPGTCASLCWRYWSECFSISPPSRTRARPRGARLMMYANVAPCIRTTRAALLKASPRRSRRRMRRILWAAVSPGSGHSLRCGLLHGHCTGRNLVVHE